MDRISGRQDGGMLLGVDNVFYNVLDTEIGGFFVKALVEVNTSKEKWNVVSIFLNKIHVLKKMFGMPLLLEVFSF